MTSSRERGEGKIGCILSLLVLAGGIAVGLKVVPVLYSNNALEEYAADVATKASIFPVPALELQLRDKAKELEIPEALAEGAMTISASGTQQVGTCTVKLTYSRKVDLYGVYPLTFETRKVITKGYMDVR
jgi:hypothetical protein